MRPVILEICAISMLICVLYLFIKKRAAFKELLITLIFMMLIYIYNYIIKIHILLAQIVELMRIE